MIRLWKLALLVVSLLAFAPLMFSSAANVYITPNGANQGVCTSNPQAPSWFNNAANWGSGTSQIGPGTTVHLCGVFSGGANASILTFQGSGTSGNPITLKFETGSGLSAPYCSAAAGGAGCITMSNLNTPRSYIVVDGGTPCGWDTATNASEGTCNGYIVNTQNGTGLSYNKFTTGIEMEACSNCEIKNMLVYNLYQNIPGDSTANVQQINCVYWSGSNNSIHDSTFHDAGWCLGNSWLNGDTNNSVYNNNIYAVAHGMFNSAGGPLNASDFYVYGNYFHDYQVWNNGGFHTDGIHTFGNLGNGLYPLLTGYYVYNNIFGGDSGNSLSSQIYLSGNTNATGTDGAVHDAWVFNNVFEVSQATDNGIMNFAAGSGHLFYNNTVINSNATIGGACLMWGNISQARYTFIFKNDAFQGCAELIISNANEVDTGITADYNAYATCSGGNCWAAFYAGGTGNWTQYLTNPYGQDQQSVASLPINSGSLGLNSSYQPTTGSIVIGAGTNLSSLCKVNGGQLPNQLCSDITGTPRSATGAWDAGAYHLSNNNPPTPPTGLTAIVN